MSYLRIFRYLFVILVFVPLFLAVVTVGLIDLPAVQREAEKHIPQWTNGMVQLEGLHAVLPWHITISHIVVKDAQGVWLEAKGTDIRLGVLKLLHKRIPLRSIGAEQVLVMRKPIVETSEPQNAAPASPLPAWGIGLDGLYIKQVQVGEPILGRAAVFKVDGHVFIKNLQEISQISSTHHVPRADIILDVVRQDAIANFHLNISTHRKNMRVNLHYNEDSQGLAALLAHMPILSPLVMDAQFSGPYQNVIVQTVLHAGRGRDTSLPDSDVLGGTLKGVVDLPHQQLDLTLGLHSAAIRVKPDIGWERLNIVASAQGAFMRPLGQVVLDINSLTAHGNDVGHAHIQLNSAKDEKTSVEQRAEADTFLLASQFDGVRLQGQSPTLLAQTPLLLNASFQPMKAGRPFEVKLVHGTAQLAVKGEASNIIMGHLQADISHLSEFSTIIGQPLEGAVHLGGKFAVPLQAKGDISAQLDGMASLSEGPYQAVSLIGREGKLSLDIIKNADDSILLNKFRLSGHRFTMDASGGVDHKNRVAGTLRLVLSELVGLHPALRGKAVIDAQADGLRDDIGLKAHFAGELGVQHPHVNVPVGPLDMRLNIAHVPSHPQGEVELKGVLDRSPLYLAAAFEKKIGGAIYAALKGMEWKSFKGQAAVSLLAGEVIPRGKIHLTIARLEELSSLLGQPIAGHFLLDAQSAEGKEGVKAPHDGLHIAADAHMQMDHYAVNMLRVKGDIYHLPTDPIVDLAVHLAGLRANGLTGGVDLSLNGPLTALAVRLDGMFEHVMHGPASVSMALVANLSKQLVRLDKFIAHFKSDEAHLQGATTLHWGRITALDHLQLLATPFHGKTASLRVNGTVKPQLALDAALEHVTPTLVEPFMPSVRGKGEFSAGLKLRGTLAAPVGHVQFDGTGLRLVSQETDFLPDGILHFRGDLDGKKADIDGQLQVGHAMALQISGHMPFVQNGNVQLNSKGGVDLSLANAILGADGMGVAGRVDMEMDIRGTLQHPMAFGQVRLRDGRFDHYVHGVHLEGMEGQLHAHGDDVDIEHFVAHAGQGTIGLSGHVGIFKPSMPLDVSFMMDHAQPILSDFLTEVIDSRLHIYGQAATRIDVVGDITVPQASINLPSSMPASVPQLDIVTSPHPKKERQAPSRMIGLNVAFNVPGQLFIRGHGLFAEMEGKLGISGTSSTPDITGGISLKRGSFNLAGVNLDFTHGMISFNGAGSTHKLDPIVDFRADRNAEGTLASLLVTGYASAPKFDFVSTPSLPRDEVLSILLFGVNRAVLSPMQLASLGLAIVQIGGGSAFDPMGRVRSALGLDHLAIGGGSSVGNGEANVEAGKYVMKGVYVGAREGLSGKATQAQVKIDITKDLKFNATVGTGGQVTGFTTPENDPGSSIGLSYGIDY